VLRKARKFAERFGPRLGFAIALLVMMAKVVWRVPVTYSERDPLCRLVFDQAWWLSLSYVSGFAMYWFVVELPKGVMRPFLATETAYLVGHAKNLVLELKRAVSDDNAEIKHPMKRATLEQICEAANLDLTVPKMKQMNGAVWTVRESLVHHRGKALEAIEHLHVHIGYMEAEHVRLLARLASSSFLLFSEARRVYGETSRPDLYVCVLRELLWDYYQCVLELEQFAIERKLGPPGVDRI
jgi:hypothetical protein